MSSPPPPPASLPPLPPSRDEEDVDDALDEQAAPDHSRLTRDDIADLCSQLQSVVEHMSRPADTGSPQSTPTLGNGDGAGGSSSSIHSVASSGRQDTRAVGDCPCRHIVNEQQGAASEQCALCGRVIPALEEMRSLRSRVATQQQDLAALNSKYVDQIDRVAALQHAKAQVDAELEDLSRQLFEEANVMVACEKREKTDLQRELADTRERLATQEAQLRQLRQMLQDEVERGGRRRRRQGSSSDGDSSDNDGRSKEVTPASDIDPMVMDEFGAFVEQSGAVAPRKLATLPFVKHSVEEDVLPCLRFGPQPRMSARKLVDAIALNTCTIERTPTGFVQAQQRTVRETETPLQISALKLNLWDRFSGDSAAEAVGGCQACGRRSALEFRMRIAHDDDWACIDAFCRTRLVAVCEFFVFLRNVQQGHYSHRSVPDLYDHAQRLRLQMFLGRTGVVREDPSCCHHHQA